MPAPDSNKIVQENQRLKQQQAQTEESNKAEQLKRDTNLIIGNAQIAQAAQLNRLERDRLERLKTASVQIKSKKDDSAPVKAEPKLARKPDENLKKKKEEDAVEFDFDQSMSLTAQIQRLYAVHQYNIFDIFANTPGVISKDPAIEATQVRALVGIKDTIISASKLPAFAPLEQKLRDAEVQDPIILEPDFESIGELFQDLRARDRQRVAAAMVINPAYNEATSALVVPQYMRAVKSYENTMVQFTTDYTSRAPQYPRAQVSTTLAAWLELQLLGSSKILQKLHTEKTFIPAFFNQLQLAAISGRRKEVEELSGGVKPRKIMTPLPTRPAGF